MARRFSESTTELTRDGDEIGEGLAKWPTPEKHVRCIFVDEGGISRNEPTAIVCGFVLDELAVPRLEAAIDDIIAAHIPAEHRDGFVLHATDIWFAKKLFKDRDRWPWARRAAILRDITALPRLLDIPIVFGWNEKRDLHIADLGRAMTADELDRFAHVMSFLHCTLTSEKLMRVTFPGEVAQLIAEDNKSARQTIRDCFELLRTPDQAVAAEHLDVIPLNSIVGEPRFVGKREAKVLQLADACSFMVRRHFEHRNAHDHWRAQPFYNNLLPMLFDVPRIDAPMVLQWPFGPSLAMTAG